MKSCTSSTTSASLRQCRQTVRTAGLGNEALEGLGQHGELRIGNTNSTPGRTACGGQTQWGAILPAHFRLRGRDQEISATDPESAVAARAKLGLEVVEMTGWKRNHPGFHRRASRGIPPAPWLDVVIATRDSAEKSHDWLDRQNHSTADVMIERPAVVEIHADSRSNTRPISPKLKDTLSRGSDMRCPGVRPSL